MQIYELQKNLYAVQGNLKRTVDRFMSHTRVLPTGGTKTQHHYEPGLCVRK